MSLSTISKALSKGEKTLKPITDNYKYETFWILSDCLNMNHSDLL